MTTDLYIVIGVLMAVVTAAVWTLAVSWDRYEKRFFLADGASEIGPLYILYLFVALLWPVAILAGIVAIVVWIVARLIEGMVRR